MTNTNEPAAFTTCPECRKVVNVRDGRIVRHLVAASWQHQILHKTTRRVCRGAGHTVPASKES